MGSAGHAKVTSDKGQSRQPAGGPAQIKAMNINEEESFITHVGNGLSL